MTIICELLKKIAPCVLFIILLFPRGIAVQSVEAIRAMFAQIFFVFRCIFRVFGEISLQLLATMFVASLLDGTFQIPHLSLVWVRHNRILSLKLDGKLSTLPSWLAS
jgi:hypothetical protein